MKHEEEALRQDVVLKVLDIHGTALGAESVITIANEIVNYILTGEVA